jgi:hypothetical protein
MPFKSQAQRRWAHTAAGVKALGGKKVVSEFDTATKGLTLPERKSGEPPDYLAMAQRAVSAATTRS